MSTIIPILAAPSAIPLPTPQRAFDYEEALRKMELFGEEGRLSELLYQCGQTLIVAHRRGIALNREVADLVARMLLIAPEGVDLGGTFRMIKAYGTIRALIEDRLSALLAPEEPEAVTTLIGSLNLRLNRWGMFLPTGGRLYISDFSGMPLPLSASGRSRLETVWIEATNHCNQKCTFCPDPLRETPRELADVDQFKKRARELHDSFEVGYWQMNAYGEPLLHPQLPEMINFLRHELKSPAPVYFTTHGLTLTEPRIKKLLAALPNEVMVSLHNDSQASYAISRSEKIGNYALLTDRIFAFCTALIAGAKPCSVRLSVLVDNAYADPVVSSEIRSAFANTPERFLNMVVSWQERFRLWAQEQQVEVHLPVLDPKTVAAVYEGASHGPEHIVPVAQWESPEGPKIIFISPRPVGSYANLLPYQADPASITPYEASAHACGFVKTPSLTIFANGKLGICCLDLETTASFGHADDHPTLAASLKSRASREMFANLSFGVSDNPGCAICLGTPARA